MNEEWMSPRLEDELFKATTREDIIEIKIRIDEASSDIKADISAAGRAAATRGTYMAPADWDALNDEKSALAVLGQRAQLRLSQLKSTARSLRLAR